MTTNEYKALIPANPVIKHILKKDKLYLVNKITGTNHKFVGGADFIHIKKIDEFKLLEQKHLPYTVFLEKYYYGKTRLAYRGGYKTTDKVMRDLKVSASVAILILKAINNPPWWISAKQNPEVRQK